MTFWQQLLRVVHYLDLQLWSEIRCDNDFSSMYSDWCLRTVCSVSSNSMSILHPLPQPVSSFCWYCDQNVADSTVDWKDLNVTFYLFQVPAPYIPFPEVWWPSCCWLNGKVSIKVCHWNISLWQCCLLTEMCLHLECTNWRNFSLCFVHVCELAGNSTLDNLLMSVNCLLSASSRLEGSMWLEYDCLMVAFTKMW